MRSLVSCEGFRAGRLAWSVGVLVTYAALSGCADHQAEQKKGGQQLISTELAQIRARHNEELTTLRERELPQLRGTVEQAMHRSRELENKQEDLKHRIWELEQEVKKLRQIASQQQEVSTLKEAASPLSRSIQERLEVQEDLINSLMNQLTEQSKRLRTIEKIEKIDKVTNR